MKIPRIYVDTSVLGGCFDPEFRTWSVGLMEDFRRGRFRAILSEVTAAEIEAAPEAIRAIHGELLASGAELIEVSREALTLQSAYQRHSVLPLRFQNDMLHIALATVAEVDVLVSWNFRHIVRLDKIRLFNGINLELGYRAIAIYSPREVTTLGRED
jgi:hypothetical protein